MDRQVPRREALRRLAVLSASIALPGVLFQTSCSNKPSCSDVTGLTPEEVQARNVTNQYTETAPDPAKKCSGCAQWTGAPNAKSCGGCKVVKGPINPDGWCKLFVAKPA